MGSRRYTGRRGPKRLASYFRARHFGIKAVLVCAFSGSLLVTCPSSAHAQPPIPPTLNALPKNHQLPLTGGLGNSVDVLPEHYQAKAPTKYRPKRRKTIPTLRARYRPQDGDLFGEGQANSGDAAEGSIFEALEKGPQPPATKRPAQTNPFAEPNQANPFGEPQTQTPTPFDPSPREPLMDTQLEQPTPRTRKRTSGQTLGGEQPRLPDGSEYTPDSGNIPELPMPDGGTRSTEKAGSGDDAQGDSSILIPPEEEDISTELRQLKRELDNLDLVDPRDRSPRSDQSSRRRRGNYSGQQDFRRRPTGSNVYRPAREPSYYSRSTDYGSVTYGQSHPGYDPNNPYASYPHVAPNDMEMIVQNAVRHAMQNYAANPSNPAVAPYYGCGYECPPCPTGSQAPPSPDCGCGPHGVQADPAAMLSQQFAQPASSSCSSAVTNEVYEGVVCGDQEIESTATGCFPRKASGLSIGGIGLGAIRNDGPNIYYGSIFGGWVGLDDLMLSGDEGQIQISNDSGVAGGFALGQIQGKNLRSELEVTYRGNDLTAMTLNDLAGSTQLFEGDGKIDTVSGMLNVIWDFTDLPSRCFTPYLGAGIGGVSANADFQINGQNVLGDGNDTSLAYQWIAGISVKTQSLSDLYVEYRYFAADSLHFNTTLPASAIIDGDGELEYRTSNVLFGFRKKF